MVQPAFCFQARMIHDRRPGPWHLPADRVSPSFRDFGVQEKTCEGGPWVPFLRLRRFYLCATCSRTLERKGKKKFPRDESFCWFFWHLGLLTGRDPGTH